MKTRVLKCVLPVLLGVAALLLSACSNDNGKAAESAESAPDVTAEMQAFYDDNPEFFSFKTPADIPAGLVWEDGQDLPDLGSPEAKKGGTFSYYVNDFPRTLRRVGPDANGPFRGWINDFMIPSLANRHPNEGKYYSALAAQWSISPEDRTVYFKLDKTATWSDGVPITADDYMFMFFFFRSPHIVAPWYNNWYGTQYSNITKYDDYTISMTIPKSKPHFEDSLVGLSPIPRHFFKELGSDYVDRYQWRFVPTPGAYIIHDEDIKKGRSITLTRLENWWAKDKKFFRNRFNVDKIRLSVIRDAAKAFEAYKRGDIDLFRLNTPELWYEKLPDTDEDVQSGYISKDTFYTDIPRPTYGLWMNTNKPLLDNKNVRVGIHHALNWTLVIDKFFRGDFQRMRTSADGFGPATHPTLRARSFDIDKAVTAFAKSGFTERGADGILVNIQGDRLSFTLSTPYGRYGDILTILKEEAIKAGLELRVEVLDATAGFKKANEKKHDIQFTALNVGGRYPRYWETYHSDNAYDQAFLADGSINPERKIKVQTNNIEALANWDIDQLINRYRAAATEEELVATAHKLEEALYEHASFVPGFVQGYERSSHWRWLKFPDDFDVKESHYVYEGQLFWLDDSAKKETKSAMKADEKFPVKINVHDKYKVQ